MQSITPELPMLLIIGNMRDNKVEEKKNCLNK